MTTFYFFFSSRRRHTRSLCDWSSDVCSSDLAAAGHGRTHAEPAAEGRFEDLRHRDRGRHGLRDEGRPAEGFRSRLRRIPHEADRRSLAPERPGGIPLEGDAQGSPHLLRHGAPIMKVLVVDDDPDFCQLTTSGLEKAGIAYRTVRAAHEAREVLAGPDADSFDVILLDVELPGTKGWEFLSELREKGRQIPVVFVTAHRSFEDRVQGLNLGADDYIVKP